jgi:hypothetical protein
MMKLHCRRCGVELTAELEKLKDPFVLCEDDGKDHIPQGYYCLSDGEYYTGSDGQIIVNLRDVVNLKNHSDTARLNGCCGLDGCNGMNKLCKNGHEVATEKSDCWLAQAVLFDSQQIEMK